MTKIESSLKNGIIKIEVLAKKIILPALKIGKGSKKSGVYFLRNMASRIVKSWQYLTLCQSLA